MVGDRTIVVCFDRSAYIDGPLLIALPSVSLVRELDTCYSHSTILE